MPSHHSFDVATAADSVYRMLDGRTLLGRWRLSYEPTCLVVRDTLGMVLEAYVAWDPDGYSELTGCDNDEDAVVAKFYFASDGPETVLHDEYSVHLDPVDVVGSARRMVVFLIDYLSARMASDPAVLEMLAPQNFV